MPRTSNRRTLSVADRKSYIAAVKCVQAKPSIYPPGAVPGSIGLFDDFVAVHLNQTPFIHLTVSSSSPSVQRLGAMLDC